MAKKKTKRDSRKTASAPAEIEQLVADVQAEESPEEVKDVPARSLNRWRVGSLSILQLLLLAVTLLAI
ncbi:MAG: hypothetical protein R3242_10165, partial [Akkermansiaceae bacterium]|nr:hypothetical protein [Akkermansiaceae bacterium]